MNPEGEQFTTKLKKPAGAYLIGVAIIVAAFFITDPLITSLLDPTKVWAALDIMMLIGLLTALAFNTVGKQALEEEMERDESMSQRNSHAQAALPGAAEQG